MIRETGDNGGTIPETTVVMDENMESLIIGGVATATERQEEKEIVTEEQENAAHAKGAGDTILFEDPNNGYDKLDDEEKNPITSTTIASAMTMNDAEIKVFKNAKC